MNIDEIARDLSHEAYDRFVMGGWEAEDFVETARQAIEKVADYAGIDMRRRAVRIASSDAAYVSSNKDIGVIKFLCSGAIEKLPTYSERIRKSDD